MKKLHFKECMRYIFIFLEVVIGNHFNIHIPSILKNVCFPLSLKFANKWKSFLLFFMHSPKQLFFLFFSLPTEAFSVFFPPLCSQNYLLLLISLFEKHFHIRKKFKFHMLKSSCDVYLFLITLLQQWCTSSSAYWELFLWEDTEGWFLLSQLLNNNLF